MARGELMKKLLASFGQEEEFRAIAELIIGEEEKKKNRVLADSLRKSLDAPLAGRKVKRQAKLAPLLPFPDAAGDFVERIEPTHDKSEVVLSASNIRILLGLQKEYRKSNEIRRHGLDVRSKVLFCGPPGNGKTLTAEVFAGELGLVLYVVKLDRLISSYLGETASNLRKIFELARTQPCVIFFDEFDALARARDDNGEHNELRRVVNSLLVLIDRLQPKGFLIAATNHDIALDPAIWRRFDEIIWFEKPDQAMIKRFLRLKFKNIKTEFDPLDWVEKLVGFSYAEIERTCLQAIKSMIIEGHKRLRERDFNRAIADESRRRSKNRTIRS